MAKPTLNFVWIGPPRFDQGGQDVVGPETIDANFKAFPAMNDPPNPMTYWCQTAYVKQYQDYFASKGMTIHVASIETYLKSSDTEKDNAQIILGHYHELIENPERNRPLDRVNMKEIFFNFILATQGGYVLDTNVQAISLKQPVIFPLNDKFMFPCVTLKDTDHSTPVEVWMQYAPPHNLARAKQCLDCYLFLYSQATQHYQGKLYSEIHHTLNGNIPINAVCLHKELTIENNKPEVSYHDDSCDTWHCGSMIDGTDILVANLGVFKEYYNTHKMNREYSDPEPHLHVVYGNLEKLTFDLTHGINPNLETNLSRRTYDINNETLLHRAMRHSDDPKCRNCAQLLLTYGADPNKVFTIKYHGMDEFKQESPLISSIKNRTEIAMKILFEHAKTPVQVDQILNNESSLIVAVKCNTGVDLLLQHHANPNQRWPGQQETPLACAVREGSVDNIDLLLKAQADPNTPVSQDDDHPGKTRIISETPLHIALRKQDAITVKKLLQYGADPFAVAQYKGILGWVSKQKASEIKTSKLCRQILADAIQQYHQDHHKESPQHHSKSTHRIFKPAEANPVSEKATTVLPANENPVSDASKKSSDP